MADTFTTYYNLTKPQVGGDPDTWGGLLNTNFDTIDTTMHNISVVANAALPTTGGTLTGNLAVNTSASNAQALTLTNTGTNGAQIQMTGQGATTPSKFLRVFAGIFQIVNNANSVAIFSLDDAGNGTFGGSVSGTTASFSGNGTIGGTLAVNGGSLTVTNGATAFFQINPLSISGTYGVAAATNIPFVIGVNNAESARVSQAGVFTLSGAANGNGAQVVLNGNGATTPNKTIRARSGSLEIVNSANTAIISTLTDGGVWSATDFTATSDSRLKEIIGPLKAGYAELKKIQPMRYLKYANEAHSGEGREEVGFIAQKVQQVLPTAVEEGDYLSVSPMQLIALVANAVLQIGRALELEGII